MKINFEQLINNNGKNKYIVFRKEVVINSLLVLTNNNIQIISDDAEYKENGTFDMTININGFDLDPTYFIENLVETIFDKEIDKQRLQDKYNSKNSPNAKLTKVNDNLGMVKTMLQNIENTLTELNR